MSSLPVFADALSRLHADIAITRLVRAGISRDRISAIFPRRLAPNSVCCWLSSFHHIPLATPAPMAAAGLLGELFKRGLDLARMGDRLEQLGLDPDLTGRLREKVRAGATVICVHARTETEATIATHIFLHVGAEDLTCAVSEQPSTPAEWSVLTPQWSSLAA